MKVRMRRLLGPPQQQQIVMAFMTVMNVMTVSNSKGAIFYESKAVGHKTRDQTYKEAWEVGK